MSPTPEVDIGRLNLVMSDRFIVFPETSLKETQFMASHLINHMVSRHFNPNVEKWQVSPAIARTVDLQKDRRYQNMQMFERVAFNFGKNNPIKTMKLNLGAESDFDQQLLARYILGSGIARDRTKGLLFISSSSQAEALGVDLLKTDSTKLGAFVMTKQEVVDCRANRKHEGRSWQQIEPTQK